MIKCIYKIGNKVVGSYTDLLNILKDLPELKNFNDIVYSKQVKQQSQIDLLDGIKHDYNTKAEDVQLSFLNGEPASSKGMNILQFIDSGDFIVNGHRPVTPFNEADYVKEKTEQLINSGVSKEDAQKQIQAELSHNKKIGEDSILIHSVINDPSIADPNFSQEEFVSRYSKTFSSFPNGDKMLADLYTRLHQIYMSQKGSFTDSITKRNVNFAAKTKDGKEILGHIDQLIVGKDGSLHLYLFKTTSDDYKDWIGVKREKYDFQLSFLKQMLKANGLDVSNITLSIIPIWMQYDSDYSNMTGIRVRDPQERSSSKKNEYVFEKYDKYTRLMIPNTSKMKEVPSSTHSKADDVFDAIFPDLNVKEKGISESARIWIDKAPSADPNGTAQLVIREVNTDHRYDVIINGTVHHIKSGRSKNVNKKIFKLVSKHISELEDNKGYSIQKLKDAIESSYKKGFLNLSEIKGLRGSEVKLRGLLYKYLHYTKDESGNKFYDWVMESQLIDSNILVFRNVKTNVVDFINLTAFNINAQAKLTKGEGILGAYEYQDSLGLRADYGNVEAVRTMALINEIIPSLKDVALGTMHILSSTGDTNYRSYNIGNFNQKYFRAICDKVTKENSDLTINNNFSQINMESPIDSILQTLLAVTDGKNSSQKERILDLGFGELTDLDPTEHENIVNALYNIIQNIYNEYPNLQDPEEVKNLIYDSTTSQSDIAKLLELVTRVYNSYTGQTPIYQTDFGKIERNVFTSTTVSDANIRTIVDNLQITHDAIAREFLDKYDQINDPFMTYYKEIGYTPAQNMSAGNQAGTFSNLFQKDLDTGKNLMIFKNPYDTTNDLTLAERKLLKKVLYNIAYIHSNGNLPFFSNEDSKISKYIKSNPQYLWVPLIRASSATQFSSKDAWMAKIRNGYKRFKKAIDRYDEFVNGVTKEERKEILSQSENFYMMQARNPFDLSIPNSRNVNIIEEKRRNMLDKYGPEFFETNVENILKEFLVQQIGTYQFNKLLVGTKAFMLQLMLRGEESGNSKVMQKELEWLQNYLRVNVFKEAIMSKDEQKIVGTLMPVRHIVSHMLVGGNIVGAFRDVFEGVQQNFIRSVLKYQTDLKPKYVAEALAYVSKNGTTNAMSVNLLSKLCLMYRLSNTDVGRIAERSKTGRNGITNWQNGLYFTLRGPDFLNRMTLFVARCMQDGVWNAYSIDKNGRLVYDWKKDTRFTQYANGNTSHVDYNKQKALYLSKIREYNQEHPNPEDKIPYDGDLPAPYSDKEILNIRNLGDNIYGSYDKSKKSMMENYSWCIFFGMFTTWMNGIVNNYFMKSQRNGAFGYNRVQDKDVQGRLLYFDNLNNITTEKTDLPVYTDEPIVVQGIYYTLKTLSKILVSFDNVPQGFQNIKEYLKADQHERANLMKLSSDALMALFYWLLFSLVLDPEYKEYKKSMKDNPVVVNALTEILYKSASRSHDQFKGPLNIIEFLGENMNPPVYSQPISLISDMGKSIFGDKEWSYALINANGITRSFKDTYNGIIKAQEK